VASLLDQVPHEPTLALVDSLPLPVCQFAHARRCQRFRGEASFGKDFMVRQTFYGFRLHVRLCWPGLISRIVVAPANVWEPAVVPVWDGKSSREIPNRGRRPAFSGQGHHGEGRQ
jgi:hypothetical protein